MEIHLNERIRNNLDAVKDVATKIETTKLIEVADIDTDLNAMKIIVHPLKTKLERKRLTVKDIEFRLKKIPWFKGEIIWNAKSKYFVIKITNPTFKKLYQLSEYIKNLRVKGIEGITRAIIRYTPQGYVLYTEGSNLAKVLEMPEVDPANTTTNSITEIYDVLGIEAARNAIINEATKTLQEQGLNVDIRHIMLVADIMTCDGDVKAIGRHGISGRKSSVLARAAFEITSQHLLRAGVVGDVDFLGGVAENIIVGQPVTLGTGAVNIVYAPPRQKRS
jgi:DNA-directed RNA polymerase subunit A"